jgi:hypothetical protein
MIIYFFVIVGNFFSHNCCDTSDFDIKLLFDKFLCGLHNRTFIFSRANMIFIFYDLFAIGLALRYSFVLDNHVFATYPSAFTFACSIVDIFFWLFEVYIVNLHELQKSLRLHRPNVPKLVYLFDKKTPHFNPFINFLQKKKISRISFIIIFFEKKNVK